MHNLPIIGEPFRRIAIDIVGPLLICKTTGNRFILSVTGPLSLVKGTWLSAAGSVASNQKSVVDFVLDMRERLKTALDKASSYNEMKKGKSKLWYDRKARSREFKPGDEVLALLPIPGSPLSAKFSGPYSILQKLGPVDYLLDTPTRRRPHRICHVNLLKPYRRRDEKLFPRPETVTPVCVTAIEGESDFGNSTCFE